MSDTVECLGALALVDYPRLTVILVNNGSSDFSPERARQAFGSAIILGSETNLGYAGGCNLGIGRAFSIGAEYVLLLNSDTTVSPDLVWRMLEPFGESEVGIVGPVIAYHHSPDAVWFAGGGYSRLLGLSYRDRPLAPTERVRPVGWVNGCALMLSRSVIETIGLLWEGFFLNFEELDLCLRAARAGFRCLLVGEPLVRHKVSAAGGIRGTDRLTGDKAYYFARNPFHLIRRNMKGFFLATALLSQLVLVLPYRSIGMLIAGDAGSVRDYLTGLIDGLRGRSGPRVGPCPGAGQAALHDSGLSRTGGHLVESGR